MPDPDERTTEELQRAKLMLEIRKLEQDILAQDIRLKREGRTMILAALGGAATFLAAALAAGKWIFGG
jgi:hypothetical protein